MADVRKDACLPLQIIVCRVRRHLCVLFSRQSVAPLMGYPKTFPAPVMASPFPPVLLSLCLERGVLCPLKYGIAPPGV